MTIYLFGDSYVENEPAHFLNVRDHERWYDILSKRMNEENVNYGQAGEGPIETMEKFQTGLESGYYNENDKFVIALSSPFRIPWKWRRKGRKEDKANQLRADDILNSSDFLFRSFKQELGVGLGGGVSSAVMEDSYFSGIDDADVKFNEMQIFTLKSFYDCMHDELSYTNVKNICLLKHISIQNNLPIIVFTVFDWNNTPMEKKSNNMSVYNLEYINDDLFYYYPTPLFEHSMREWKNKEKMNEGMLNHFSERNHEIVANIICNHFTDSDYSVKFHEGFIIGDKNSDNRGNIDSTKYVDFIYD